MFADIERVNDARKKRRVEKPTGFRVRIRCFESSKVIGLKNEKKNNNNDVVNPAPLFTTTRGPHGFRDQVLTNNMMIAINAAKRGGRGCSRSTTISTRGRRLSEFLSGLVFDRRNPSVAYTRDDRATL